MAAPTALYALLGNSTGTQYYVDNVNGNNSNTGLSTGQAWLTIEKARDTVPTNAIINLRATGVEYRPVSGERWVWQKNGTSAADPITLRTYPGDSPDYRTGINMAKLRGSILAGGSGSTRFGGLKITDVDISNTVGLTRGTAGVEGIKIENFQDIEIARCWIHQTVETGILITGSVSDAIRVNNWHVHHCMIFRCGTSHPGTGNNHDHGIYIGGEVVGGAHSGQAYNNLIFDCHYGSCIQFFPLGTSNIVAYNTMYDTSELNALDGTALGNPVMFFYGQSGGSGLGLTDNVVSSNILVRSRQDATTRLAIETGLNTGTGNRIFKNLANEITNSTLWGSSTMWVNNATRAADNLIQQSPLWVDVTPGGNKDFHLLVASPARNAGETAFLPADDFFGTARNSVADIGAVAVDPGALGVATLAGVGTMSVSGTVERRGSTAMFGSGTLTALTVPAPPPGRDMYDGPRDVYP